MYILRVLNKSRLKYESCVSFGIMNNAGTLNEFFRRIQRMSGNTVMLTVVLLVMLLRPPPSPL